jgi:MinD-like ATPase involved in chromosome partitioning or flagellar assembly
MVPPPDRSDASGYRRPSGSDEPSVPTPAIRVPLSVRRERIPGGTALDGLDQRDAASPARVGWREVIRRVTGIDLGPGKELAYEAGLRDRVRTPLGSAFPIAVLNLKGGVGKTAVVEGLGSTFADARDDRIIAVDLDAGDLVDRHGRRSPLSMADLISDDTVTRYSDVRAHTYMNSCGLEVLGLPDYAHTNWRLGRGDVVKTFSILRKHYSVVLVDCDKALKSNVMEAVLPESRALVVVSSTSIDAIRKTRTTLEWLSNNGYRKLIGSTVLAINHIEPRKLDTVAAKELEHLSAHVAATVVLPFDRHVHEGKEIGLDKLSKDSRRCYLEMAAALADMFPIRAMAHDLGGGHSRSR